MKYLIMMEFMLFALCAVIVCPLLALLSLSGRNPADGLLGATENYMDRLHKSGGLTDEEYKEAMDILKEAH